MMRDEITPERLANAIMQDVTHKGATLVVEGHADYILFRKFIDNTNCQISTALGRNNVIDVIGILNARSFPRALGIVDSDFYSFDPFVMEENLLLTDYHDIEMMAVSTNAFSTVLDVYSDSARVQRLEADSGQDIRTLLMNLVKPLGVLRLINSRYNLGLAFKARQTNGNNIDYGKFIEIQTLTYKGDEFLVEAVVNYSRNRSQILVTNSQILEMLSDFNVDDIDLYALCNGHDFCNVLSLGCRKKMNNLNANDCQKEHIERSLILSYDSAYFSQSILYSEIKEWERYKQLRVLSF